MLLLAGGVVLAVVIALGVSWLVPDNRGETFWLALLSWLFTGGLLILAGLAMLGEKAWQSQWRRTLFRKVFTRWS